MNRRDFLRGVAGVTAAGVILPSEEIVRRFWPGAPWARSPKHGDRHPMSYHTWIDGSGWVSDADIITLNDYHQLFTYTWHIS